MASKVAIAPSASMLLLAIRPSTQCLNQTQHHARQFSNSMPLQKMTRRRRKFFQWLEGPGQAFKQPRPGATNYLTAYDRDGQVISGPKRADKDFNTQKAALAQEGQSSPEEQVKEGEDELDPEQMERRETEKSMRPEVKKERTRAAIARPFPLNRDFVSESVLSEEMREAIYLQIAEEKKTIRSVSSEMGVSMERVGAVVRMKQMERDWLRKGKPLAVPYARAVLAMLPTTPLGDSGKSDKWGKAERVKPHESINDLPVHPRTTQQIFYPVSESRAFTRADAGKAFDPTLLPADDRIPHPELIAIERIKKTTTNLAKFKQDILDTEQAAAVAKAEELQEMEKRTVKTYAGQKYDFRFQDVSVDFVGKTGRSRAGVGWRYGTPHDDRKPGKVKIPTSVNS